MIESKKKVLLTFVYLFINLALTFVLSLDTFSSQEWLNLSGLGVFFHIVISLALFRMLDYRILGIAPLFMIATYLIHFSQFILINLNFYQFYRPDFITRYPDDVYRITLVKTLLITSFITVGMCLVSINNHSYSRHQEHSSSNIDFEEEKCNCIRIGRTIIMLTLPIRLLVDIKRLWYSIHYGYNEAVVNLGFGNYVIIASRFAIFGIVLLFLGLKQGSSQKKWLFYISFFYLFIMMISGSRMTSIIDILVLALVYIRTNRVKINLRLLVLLFALLTVAAAFMETIRQYRMYGSSMNEFFELFGYYLTKNNIILQLFEELGQSIYTCSAVVDYMNMTDEYGKGITYLLGPVDIFPNIGNIVNEVERKTMYHYQLRAIGIRGGYQNIGGSYIGEIIYNFKYTFWIFGILLGCIVGKVSLAFDAVIDNGSNCYNAIYYIISFLFLLEWTRDYFPSSIRFLVWSYAFCWCVKNVFKRSKRRT